MFQAKGYSVITPSTIGYTPELDPWPFDPDKARQLLADAGYPGGKGFGKLIVNTHASLSMPLQVEAAQLGAEFWRKELGIDVEVRVSDNTVRKQMESDYRLNGQIWWRDNETRIDGSVGGVIANKFIDPKHRTRSSSARLRKYGGYWTPTKKPRLWRSCTCGFGMKAISWVLGM